MIQLDFRARDTDLRIEWIRNNVPIRNYRLRCNRDLVGVYDGVVLMCNEDATAFKLRFGL